MASRSAARPAAQRRWCALVALGASAPAEAFPPLEGVVRSYGSPMVFFIEWGASWSYYDSLSNIIQPHDSLSKDIQTYLRVPLFVLHLCKDFKQRERKINTLPRSGRVLDHGVVVSHGSDFTMMFLERMWPEQPKFGKHNKMPQDGIATAWTLCFMCFFAWELKHHRTWDGLLGLLGSTNVYQKNGTIFFLFFFKPALAEASPQAAPPSWDHQWLVQWQGSLAWSNGIGQIDFPRFFDLFGHLCPDFCHVFSMKGPWCELNRSWTAA